MPQSVPPHFLQLIHDPAIVFDPEEEVVLDVNALACDVYGFARDEFVGLSLREISRDPIAGGRRVSETLDRQAPNEFTTVQFRRDGRELIVAVHAMPIDYNGRTAILTVNRAVLVEEERPDTGGAAEWQFTLDSLAAAVVLVDDQGRIVRANRRAVAISGCDDAVALEGRELESAGSGEIWRGAAKLLCLALENDLPMSGKVEDAAQRSWSVSVSLAPRSSRMRAVIVISDVTAIAELEAEMHRVEAMAEFGHVVAGVAHEVRTPLFAISTTLEVLEGSLNTGDERARRRFEMMRAQIARLNSLMQDLLEYGKAPALDVSLQKFGHAIADAMQLNAETARERGVVLRNEFPAAAPEVLVDSARMVTALRNVIENAVQHAPAESVVTIRGATDTARDRVICIVDDSGSGFRPQDLPSVMQPFFTRRSGGTGLGLAIVQRTVELHGGTVTAENRAEGGARVTIELPRAG